MSTHVVMSFHARLDAVEALIQALGDLQDQSIDAGAMTASLMRDESDSARLFEEEVWDSADAHQRFMEQAKASGTVAVIEGMLASPFEVHYLDTVKYSRNRRR